MGRQEQTEEVRRKVVATALRHFLEKGYAQTTLRDISAAAGVSYGSIYHHFADKEGIFRELILAHFEQAQHIADRELAAPDVYMRLGLKWAGLVQAMSQNHRVAEMLSVAYRSWKISAPLLEVSAARHRDWLQAKLPDWSEDQFYAATLVLTGALASLVDERLHLDRLAPEARIRALLSSALPAFGASPAATQHTIRQALELAPSAAMAGLALAVVPG